MKNKELLGDTKHRPWPCPQGSWKYYQEWNRAVFLHWEVDANELRKHVPEELEIDTIEGKAWVSLVAFTMEKIRPRMLPAFPPISNFDEINIRTYVKYKGKSGVHFLSIEGGKLVSCQVARGMSELPYRYSKMKRFKEMYISQNKEEGDRFELTYNIGNRVNDKSELDLWLTERYALFQHTEKAINAFEIHHIEWPVFELEIEKLTVDYPRFSSLIGRAPDLIRYSPGVQVLAWGKEKNARQQK